MRGSIVRLHCSILVRRVGILGLTVWVPEVVLHGFPGVLGQQGTLASGESGFLYESVQHPTSGCIQSRKKALQAILPSYSDRCSRSSTKQ